MKNSNFDYQKAFFIIDSNHLKDVKSEMFGFCLLDGLVIETLEELQNQEPSSEGCYVYVNRTDKSIIIKQDFVGCYGIYLYKHGDYFALSNSFMYLVDYLKSKKPITFNKSYSDYFVSCDLCSSSKSETLVNEISIVDRSAILTIDIETKKLSQKWIDYKENTLSLDSKEGMETLDSWFSKWTKIMNYLIANNEPTLVTLSGGMDSRIPFMLTLQSGCDMNKLCIFSIADNLHTHSEDFAIATAIANEYHLKLNNWDVLDKKQYNYTMKDAINIPFYVNGGFHNFFHQKTSYPQNRKFSIRGVGGECIRSYWNQDVNVYLDIQIRRGNNYKKDGSKIKQSIEEVLRRSIDEVKTKFAEFGRPIMPEELTLNLYRESRNRTHFGKEITENYLGNTYALSPLLDSNLHMLKLNVPDCTDLNLLYAVILDRYCPKLLEFPFEGGRSIASETLEYAKKLNQKYPVSLKEDIVYTNKPVASVKNISSMQTDVAPLNNQDISEFYKRVFTSEYIYNRFSSLYCTHVYKRIEKRMYTDKFVPYQDVRMALSICKVLDAVYTNQCIEMDYFSYMENAAQSKMHIDLSSVFPDDRDFYANIENGFDAEQFKDEVIAHRNSFFNNKTIIKDNGLVYDFDKLEDIPDGRFTVMRNGVRMESLYIPYPGSDKLWVVLTGARTRDGGKRIAELPQLNMWSWSKNIGMNYLYIEDPMYYMYNSPPLLIGWYYGTEEVDFRSYVADLIKKVLKLKGFTTQNTILYGLSAGGTATMAIGKLIDGCSVIANNPQINFKEYYYSKTFKQITKTDIAENSSDGKRNDLLSNLTTSNSKFLLIINSLSLPDTRLHLKYVINKFNLVPRIGLNIISDNFVLFLYSAPGAMDAHTSLPTIPIIRALFWLTERMQKSDNISQYHHLFLLINEFYYDFYSQKKTLVTTTNEKNKLDSFAANSELLSVYLTGRVDIKNSGSEKNDIVFHNSSDPNLVRFAPQWFGKNGRGYVLQSLAGSLSVDFKCVGDGTLSIALRGKHVKDDNEQIIPIWIDFNSLQVNGETVFDKTITICHDKPFKYEFPVKDGDIIKLTAKWKPHDPKDSKASIDS